MCDDGVACTNDVCDPVANCESTTNDAYCDDADICNGAEICDAINDCQPGPLPDTDADGLTDADEQCLYGTDPADADTDDDGLLDGTEVDVAQGAGCPDPLQADSDGDTLSDGEEVDLELDPCTVDTDGDNVPDNEDPLPTDPGVTTGYIEDACRSLAEYIGELDLSLFMAPNNNARKGRRNALANRARSAAKSNAHANYPAAIDALQSLVSKVDGVTPPPEWMVDSAEKTYVADEANQLIYLLELGF